LLSIEQYGEVELMLLAFLNVGAGRTEDRDK